MIRTIVFFLILSMFMSSCSDEFDLVDDEVKVLAGSEETVALYANFSVTDNENYIRISRGFTAENLYEYQTNTDSIYYAPEEIDVNVHKVVDGDTVATVACEGKYVEKEEGDYFDTDSVLLYKLNYSGLVSDQPANTMFVIELLTSRGKRITAQTAALGEQKFYYPEPITGTYTGFDKNTFDVRINKPLNSRIYNVTAYCSYIEITKADGIKDTATKHFSFTVGKLTETTVSQNNWQQLHFRASTGAFYNGLANDIINNGDTINQHKRMLDSVYFVAMAGNNDQALLQNTGSGNAGFTDNTTSFNNVDNGLGFFTAYVQKAHKKMNYSPTTVDSVVTRFGQRFKFRAN